MDRDLDGEMWEKRPLPGMTKDPESNDRLKQGLPIQVSCCWYVSIVRSQYSFFFYSYFTHPRICNRNGAAVLNAKPFYLSENPVRFHRVPSQLLDAEDPRLSEALARYIGETLYASCSGSEVNTLCMDFFRRGFQRAVVVPRVKVAYDWKTYDLLHRDLYPMQVWVKCDST